MTAYRPGNRELEPVVAFLAVLRIVFEGNLGIEASGTADAELPFLLGIEVDEGLAGEEALLKGLGAVHAGLLGYGEQALYLSHGEIALEQGERRRDADAVIGAQRGVLGDHPAVLDHIPDRVLGEIVLDAGILLADHVLVALEHDGRNVFLAGSGLLGDKDVAGRVGLAGKAAGSGE